MTPRNRTGSTNRGQICQMQHRTWFQSHKRHPKTDVCPQPFPCNRAATHEDQSCSSKQHQNQQCQNYEGCQVLLSKLQPFKQPSNSNNTILQGSKQSLISGRDRIGGSDHSQIFVKWPQEVCFIGPSRVRVRYNELTQPKWTAGITAIAAEENNPVVQRNMFTYLASILQDTCVFGFKSCLGAHAFILSNLEDQIF